VDEKTKTFILKLVKSAYVEGFCDKNYGMQIDQIEESWSGSSTRQFVSYLDNFWEEMPKTICSGDISVYEFGSEDSTK